ncbi:uncharacterized protein F5891DRAFT_1198328 [Suillus fuscotomentosus]|uniref:KOW domain-containing protein n=1 Tax=Suillus fuscotomentosus TaxID=1912939 RepID=A0AAD4DQR9_9AGAM|nr:uncharacterized protein F5891DRAFT_1198328 [Suillus fuscotomentosus]KAG1889804.1 hypothetical protein F5891DRAFT_1198328 [Suillus fuscotomentosus]
MQQDFEPSELDSIQIGDFIEVLDGEHMGKRGVVDWLAKGDNKLWFRDILSTESIESSGGLSSLSERGYDVRPGDIVTVVRGPEYEAKGVVQSVDFPNAHLSVLCDVMKVRNATLDSFKKDIGQEVFIIGGGHKGYQATLYSLGIEACTVAIHGQKRITVKLCDVVTKYGMRLNGAMLEGPELISFCVMRKKSYLAPPCRSTTPPYEKIPSSSSTSITEPIPSSSDPSLSVNPNTSTSDPWTVDKLDTQDNIDVGAEKLSDSGPLAWLMTKEFFSTFFNHHAMLKVSPIFDASLSKRFVSTPCPDPFCGENGPAPEGCVAAYCTSNNAGAKMKHYHIPAMYLSPAPPPSVLERATESCFFDDQLTAPPAITNAYPVMDLRSFTSEAQSASTYPMGVALSFPRKTRISAVQCSGVGFAECLLSAPTEYARSGCVASIAYIKAPSALWIHWCCYGPRILHSEMFEDRFNVSLLR